MRSRAVFVLFTALSLSSCKTIMTLGELHTELQPAYTKPRPTICLSVVDSGRLYKAEGTMAVYLRADDFLLQSARTELGLFFDIIAGGPDCPEHLPRALVSLEDLYVAGHDIGAPTILPLSEAKSFASVRIVVTSQDFGAIEINSTSNEFLTSGIMLSRKAMVVVARAAVRDAMKNSVQQLACRRGLSQCSEYRIEQQKIERPEIEYSIIRKEGEPKVQYRFFGCTFGLAR